MKPAPFDLVRPTTVEQACTLLAEAGGGAQLLAGGQTLMPLLNLRMSQPFILIDITLIEALRGVARMALPEGGMATRIGPLTCQNDVLAHDEITGRLPALARAMRHIGHHQTRNRGTFGGSIALGEPAAEIPASAVALGAVIEARSLRGMRRIPAADFYLGPYQTALAPDEIVTGIDFPDWPAGHVTMVREVARQPGDFALAGLVGALAVEAGAIVRAGIAWFGMGPTPIRARAAEAALLGARADRLDFPAIAERALTETAPFDDHHTSAAYRRLVGKRIFATALRQALTGKPTDGTKGDAA